ncbi:serine/threonine-protein kinase [Cellulomonas marina]|uniref:Serine/threonine protein kinase n=1 Tax=Cellulomonas marina TaxID=988821 RepID=A0A1I0WK19_9CELL|nr:serine/threonine-protein kinase [Cellulomonas marina]GIG27711.1 hypothetical protein Cma02nite_03110 [Cellulomonas marina]SFA89125.1 Serine/threonine protein kinase [Cellulomonas marina]
MERIGPAPGTEVGGYTVVAPLGAGGMGAVYRAVDGGGHAVALKLLHPHVGADPEARDRLRREVLALQRLRHPGVAAVLDAEADSSEAFLVTELVPGEDLEARVRREGPLDGPDLALLADGLLDALRAVHAAGVVHRDLKPSNVMVTPAGPVLIDFGIAQSADDTRVTSAGLVVGTPGYLAPELVAGQEPTPASDLWGWAAVVAWAATGRPPFGRGPADAVLARTMAGETALEGVGGRVRAALRAALDPDPARRPRPDVLLEVLHDAALGVGDDEDVADDVAHLGAAGAGGPSGDDGDTHVLPAVPPPAGATQVLPPAPPPPTGATQVLPTAPPPAPAPVHTPVTGRAPAVVATPSDRAQDGSTQLLPVRPPRAAAAAPVAVPPVGSGDVSPLVGPGAPGVPTSPGAPGPGGDTDVDPPGPGWRRPVPRRRWGSLLALALVVGAAGALVPVWTLAVVAVLLLLVRTVGSTVEAMHGRRERRGGPGRADVAAAVGTTPWHLLRALVGLLPSLVVGASVAVIVLGVLWWLLGSGTWAPTGAHLVPGEPPGGRTVQALLGGGVLVGVLAAWWGPASRTTRLGARWTLAALAPGRGGAVALVLVALVVAGLLVAQVLQGQAVDWTPLPTPTLP